MNVAIFLIGFLLLVFVVYVTVTLAEIRCDIAHEREQRRDLRDDYRKHYWDVHAAFRVLGLKKTPQQAPEWTTD